MSVALLLSGPGKAPEAVIGVTGFAALWLALRSTGIGNRAIERWEEKCKTGYRDRTLGQRQEEQ